MEFKETLFAPRYVRKNIGDVRLLIDAELPNWIATDARGEKILGLVNGKRSFEEVISEYSQVSNSDFAKSWLHCQTFIEDALRSGFISLSPFKPKAYPGRGKLLKAERLYELWLHVTDTCNFSCNHCLLSASPKGKRGISTDAWKRIVNEAARLGVKRFYITGGEPLLRGDLFEILKSIKLRGGEAVILTNGALLGGMVLRRLAKFKDIVKLQISLDGSKPKINDAIRGTGTFRLTLQGIKNAVDTGFKPAIATTVVRSNVTDIPNITRLAASLGADYHHLLFAHRRGRAASAGSFSSPPTSKLAAMIENTLAAARETGIKLDNFEFTKHSISGKRGVKRDLSNIAYDSLCVYYDGHVYPSASLAGCKPLDMGIAIARPQDFRTTSRYAIARPDSLRTTSRYAIARPKDSRTTSRYAIQNLRAVWQNSRVAKNIRNTSVKHKKKCAVCHLKFICGGGDLEHAYLSASNGSARLQANAFAKEDPLCKLNEKMITMAMYSVARDKMANINQGFSRPVIYCSMGDGVLMHEELLDGHEVNTSRSNCVLFLDLDKSREVVRRFYAEAAKNPRADLCCPAGSYNRDDMSHIPKEVLKVSYGCGSPISWADIASGEVVVDLGPGGGIDCFIAAKKVGKKGRVYGVDMTDEMLEIANKANQKVAKNLGYDVVEFKRGYLEEIPLPDKRADVVISNCVINLSPDKKRVFSEMFRILKNHGRVIISDTLSAESIPEHMKANPRLWGECVSGALTEDEYLAYLERAGFYGLSILKKSFWKEIEGHKFYSAVIRGYKFEKGSVCKYIGQKAIYKGPFKATMDEEGHLFPRNEPVEVCTDTAAKLKRQPYSSHFEVIEPNKPEKEYRCCDPGKECVC